jgi:hypothetical protein
MVLMPVKKRVQSPVRKQKSSVQAPLDFGLHPLHDGSHIGSGLYDGRYFQVQFGCRAGCDQCISDLAKGSFGLAVADQRNGRSWVA